MNRQQQHQDPYEALNIPRNASQSQIKSAYRKLALKYHPDRHRNQNISDEVRQEYSDMFTRIGNAYEILGDEKRKERYDRFGVVDDHDVGGGTATNDSSNMDQQQQQYGNGHGHGHGHRPTYHDPFGGFGSFFGGGGGGGRDPFMNDPFFSMGMGMGMGSRNQNGRSGGLGRGFMDPFEVFQEFFGEDFSHNFHNEEYMHGRGRGRGHGQQQQQQQQQQRGGGFNDDFGMGMGGFGGFGGFGRMGGGGGGLNSHMNAMNAMMNMNMQSNFPQNNGSGRTMFYSSSSSSSNFGGGNGGGAVQESVSTSTRIINGKRQTVTERVKVHPDGRVERTRETTGDDDFPEAYRLQQGQGGYGQGQRQFLEQDQLQQHEHEQKEEERRGDIVEEPKKKRRFFSKR